MRDKRKKGAPPPRRDWEAGATLAFTGNVSVRSRQSGAAPPRRGVTLFARRCRASPPAEGRGLMKDERAAAAQREREREKVWMISLAVTLAAVAMAADGHRVVSFQRRVVVGTAEAQGYSA